MATVTTNNDSALVRSVRTFLQTLIGVVIGLFVVVWAVPGVPHVVYSYLMDNVVPIALSVGIPSGVASFLWNILRKDVPNL